MTCLSPLLTGNTLLWINNCIENVIKTTRLKRACSNNRIRGTNNHYTSSISEICLSRFSENPEASTSSSSSWWTTNSVWILSQQLPVFKGWIRASISKSEVHQHRLSCVEMGGEEILMINSIQSFVSTFYSQ